MRMPPDGLASLTTPAHTKPVVFCDFDGTITRQDTLFHVFQTLIPHVAATVCPAIGRGEISLRHGLEQLISHLPTSAVGRISALISEQPLRPGFASFLEYLSARDIAFVVVSSGLRFAIEKRLASYRPLIHGIHALDVDLSGPFMRALIPHDDPEEAVRKADVLARYPASTRIVIGDSISDYRMARQADYLFARDRLFEFAARNGLAAEYFDDFYVLLHKFQVMEFTRTGT